MPVCAEELGCIPLAWKVDGAGKSKSIVKKVFHYFAFCLALSCTLKLTKFDVQMESLISLKVIFNLVTKIRMVLGNAQVP